jgi:hypothetical protein
MAASVSVSSGDGLRFDFADGSPTLAAVHVDGNTVSPPSPSYTGFEVREFGVDAPAELGPQPVHDLLAAVSPSNDLPSKTG